MSKKVGYQELSDIDKLHKQWHKLSGLHSREEWSAAIVRAATGAEIAANFAIRVEFQERSQFDEGVVNSFLMMANGLAGKVDHILTPLAVGTAGKAAAMARLKSLSKLINKQRNAVVHQGEFCSEEEALALITNAREFITTLIQLYKPDFVLKERKD